MQRPTKYRLNQIEQHVEQMKAERGPGFRWGEELLAEISFLSKELEEQKALKAHDHETHTVLVFYAIQVDDLFSNGKTTYRQSSNLVPLNRAKLWTNIGHVKNHIFQGTKAMYPIGAKIVTLVLSSTQKSETILVHDLIAAKRKETKSRRD